MDSAETKLKSLAISLGADLVGVTTRDLFDAGPLSADPRYLLPSANSVTSSALSLDRDILQDFISKKKWRSHYSHTGNHMDAPDKTGDFVIKNGKSYEKR